MKKKVLKTNDFEIIKEGKLNAVKGGNTISVMDPGKPATKETYPPTGPLPSACDALS
jgi:hypothetical protein